MDVLLTIPDGTDIDGAVVELRPGGDGPWHVAADVRIPAPARQD